MLDACVHLQHGGAAVQQLAEPQQLLPRDSFRSAWLNGGFALFALLAAAGMCLTLAA